MTRPDLRRLSLEYLGLEKRHQVTRYVSRLPDDLRRLARADSRPAAPSTSRANATAAKVAGSPAPTPKSKLFIALAASEQHRQPDGQAEERQLHSLSNNQFEHVATLRSQGQANASLARAFAYGPGQHAVDANGREQQRQRGKSPCQKRGQAPL